MNWLSWRRKLSEQYAPNRGRFSVDKQPSKADNTRDELRNLIELSEDYKQNEGKSGKFRYKSQ